MLSALYCNSITCISRSSSNFFFFIFLTCSAKCLDVKWERSWNLFSHKVLSLFVYPLSPGLDSSIVYKGLGS